MRRIVQLRKDAREGKYEELTRLLKIQGSVTGPPDDAGNWEGILAGQLLALTPEKSTAMILKAIKDQSADERWAAFALGLCGTDEGVAWIRDRVRNEQNSWAARSFIYSLGLAGAKGRKAIESLEPGAKGNLEWAISAYKSHDLSPEIEFPEFPRGRVKGELPETVAVSMLW